MDFLFHKQIVKMHQKNKTGGFFYCLLPQNFLSKQNNNFHVFVYSLNIN